RTTFAVRSRTAGHPGGTLRCRASRWVSVRCPKNWICKRRWPSPPEPPGSEVRGVRIRRVVLLVSILVLCLVLLTLQTRGRASGAADLVARVTTPVQKTLSAIHRGAFGLWSTYLDWKNVRAENRRLRADALAVSETAEENQRLRRMLELKARLPLNTLTGEIIAREWGGWVRSLTVNRGRADDVKRLTAVISPDGLVGRVVDVR